MSNSYQRTTNPETTLISVVLVAKENLPISPFRIEEIKKLLLHANGSIQFEFFCVVGDVAYSAAVSDSSAESHPSLEGLLRKYPHDQLIVADAEFSFDPHILNLLARDGCENVTHTIEIGEKNWSIWRRVCCALAGLFNRVLLGTYQTSWRASAICGSSKTIGAATNANGKAASIIELIALLRANRVTVHESHVARLASDVKPIRTNILCRELAKTFGFWWKELKFSGRKELNDPWKGNWKREAILWGVIFFIAWFVLGRNLGYPLFEPDEARNAQLAMNINETGEWLSLRLANQPYWDKPPLVAWTMALCYRWFGVNEISTRLPGNLAAIATVLLTFGLGRRIVGTRAACCGTICLVLSAGFVTCGRYVTMDSVLTCTATATLWGAYLACRGPRFKYHWWVFSGIAGALGLLAKGPILVVLTLPVLVIHHLLTGNRMLLFGRRWLVFMIPVTLIALPWYLSMAIVHPDFLSYFFWKHHIERFSEAFNHREPWWYYGPMLFITMFPASYLLPSLGKWLWSNQLASRKSRTEEVGFLVLAFSWVLIFFSLSDAKLPTYILPAFPALALVLGEMLQQFLWNETNVGLQSPIIRSVPKHASRVLLVLAISSVLFVLLTRGGATNLNFGWAAVVILLGAFLTWLAHFKTVTRSKSWIAVGILAILTFGVVFNRVVPELATIRSIHVAIKEIKSQEQFKDSPIVFFEHEDYGADLWLRGQEIHVIDDLDRPILLDFLRDHRNTILVTRTEFVSKLQRGLSWPQTISRVEGARHLFVCSPRDPESFEPRIATRYDFDGNESLR